MAHRTAFDLDYLAANIHGRRSRLAEAERLDQLARLRTLTELARTLRPERPPAAVVEFERDLIVDHVEELSTIASRLGGAGGRLLDWLRVRFQMENLKVLARGFATATALEDLRLHLIPLPADLALNLAALAGAGSIEGFAALLAPDPLRRGVERAVALYNRRPKPFFVEAGLDHGYLGELLARSRALPRADRGGVLEIACQETDTFHLMLVARGKFHYELKADALAPFHVAGSRIDRAAFTAMVGAEDLAELASLALGCAIDALPAKARGEAVEAADLETLAWNRYYRLANRTFRQSHMGLGAVVAYAAIRRVELANLIRLSEGIRAGLDARTLRRRLIPSRDVEAPRA